MGGTPAARPRHHRFKTFGGGFTPTKEAVSAAATGDNPVPAPNDEKQLDPEVLAIGARVAIKSMTEKLETGEL